jgi:hypothetical protein
MKTMQRLTTGDGDFEARFRQLLDAGSVRDPRLESAVMASV